MDMEWHSYKLKPLTEEENALPLAKFYENYPLHKPNPLQLQLLSAGPMDPAKAIRAENWLDLLQIRGYREVVYGYCLMPDGSGFYIEYSVSPVNWESKWQSWFEKWVNHHSPGMVPGQGNLRYKLYNPLDHWDQGFVNGKDDTDGIWSVEKLDMGASGDPSGGIAAISYNIDLREYGLTPERERELKEAECKALACYEEFPGHPGHHLVLHFSRPCPLGGRETMSCEWIGYYARDGKIIRDASTPVTEEYLRNLLLHNSVERMHLQEILPDLYEEYSYKEFDEN